MKEKIVMTSVIAASFADMGTTAIGLNAGLGEGGYLATRFMESGHTQEAYIARVAVSVILIGIYALSKEFPNKYTESVDKGIRLGNLVAWGVAALNAIDLMRYLR